MPNNHFHTAAYSTLSYLALPFILSRVAIKSIKTPEYRQRWSERLGRPSFPPLRKSIWIHAVSVGEVQAALPLISALAAKYPDHPLVVTTTTPTGSSLVAQKLGDTVYHSYLPYDLPQAVTHFLDHIQPVLAVVMETEIWPNVFTRLAEQNIPLIMVNARLSDKSYRRYRRISSFMHPVLAACTSILAQSESDANRFLGLGTAEDKVVVNGNLKFDLRVPGECVEQGRQLRNQLGSSRPVWVAASTHPGEEEIMLQAHAEIRKHIPDALLILVPRHPERFDTAARLSEQWGFSLLRRSQTPPTQQLVDAQTGVYIADSMGELMLMYAAADIAVVGGSFVPVGGHNMLEPASLGLPIVTGEHLFNFQYIAHLLQQEKALVVISDSSALSYTLLDLFRDQSERERMGENGRHIVRTHAGATERTLRHIHRLLSPISEDRPV